MCYVTAQEDAKKEHNSPNHKSDHETDIRLVTRHNLACFVAARRSTIGSSQYTLDRIDRDGC